ncbi:hypothetical protein ACFVVA_37150 [Kitasatospora sp. NPDC058048]|uniref:hypothetical protein n=1 Tax=Kitasatospora sp. NPDC058048 TaxID=3346313 RepID=UPI0036DB987C
MAEDRYEQYHEVVRRVAGPRAAVLIGDPAWPALGATLARVERAGHDPVTVLGRAVEQSRITPAVRSVPALLAWRINQDIPADPATARPQTFDPESVRTPVRPDPVREADESGIPPWLERPHGTVPDAELQSRLADVRSAAIQAGRDASRATEQATTAMEVARSRRGPVVTALTERYAALSTRAGAVEELQALDREYREVRQVGGLGDRTPDQLQAQLAAVEGRLRDRAMFGLLHAVRGQERRELVAEAGVLRDYIDNTAPRLAELDSRRAELGAAAGPEATRAAAYSEWLVMDRTLPQMLDTARDSDVAAAERERYRAERLEERAGALAEEYDQLATEDASRTVLPRGRAEAEEAGRTSLIEEVATLAVVTVVASAAAGAAAAAAAAEAAEIAYDITTGVDAAGTGISM